MNHKVGDRVRILPLNKIKYDYTMYWHSSMNRLAGTSHIIKAIGKNSDNKTTYSLAGWHFVEEWLATALPPITPRLKD